MKTKIIDMKGLTRGDTLAFAVRGKGVTVDVVNAYFSVKSDKNATEYMFQKSIDHGVTQVEKGLYTVEVLPSDTYDLTLGTYWYDFQLDFGNDSIITPLKGAFELTYDITREII